MNPNVAVEILKQIGISKLANFEGCLCGCCMIAGMNIDTACRKSVGSRNGILIRIYSAHADCELTDLAVVGQEVVNQMYAIDKWNRIHVRFCDYDCDRNLTCVYCNKPREDIDGYLCAECLVKIDGWGDPVEDKYDYRRISLAIPEARVE